MKKQKTVILAACTKITVLSGDAYGIRTHECQRERLVS